MTEKSMRYAGTSAMCQAPGRTRVSGQRDAPPRAWVRWRAPELHNHSQDRLCLVQQPCSTHHKVSNGIDILNIQSSACGDLTWCGSTWAKLAAGPPQLRTLQRIKCRVSAPMEVAKLG